MTVPYVLIVGCPRSGTTLLQHVVDAHPQITIAPEVFWITHYAKTPDGIDLGRPISAGIVDQLVNHKRFPELEISTSDFVACGSNKISAAEFLERIFRLYGRLKEKPFVGNKTPQYVQNIPLFHAQWPNAKFVHLIRDGRDVCLSIMSWKKAHQTAGRFVTWSEDPISTTALWWRRNVLLGREAGKMLDPQLYYEVRYESLVNDPAEECKKLCAFLKVPYSEMMLRFHDGRPGSGKHKNARSWAPITPGLRNWKTQMAPADVQKFEACSGDLLEELGYERGCLSLSSNTLRHAEQIFHSFSNGARSAGKLLPNQWQFSGV